LVVHFQPNGQVVVHKTFENAVVLVKTETYRVVGNTLIGRSEKPFLGLHILARPIFGGSSRRCSVVV